MSFSVRAVMEFDPKSCNETAGLVLLQNDAYQYRFVSTLNQGEKVVRLLKRAAGQEELLAEEAVSAGRIYLKVEAREQDYSFSFAVRAEDWIVLVEKADGRILSTDLAGGFVGAYIGMYASSNSQESDNVADFDWFEYQGY